MRMRFLRLASFALGFCVVIVLAKFVLSAGDRTSVPESIRPKLDFFALHKDEFDTVFIGASHIAMQIDPISFDAETARAGRATRSFNFGIDALTLYEVEILLREIGKLEPAQLRWCIIDAVGWGTVIAPNDSNAYTERGVWWHTPRHTARVVHSALIRDLPLLKRLKFAQVHLAHFVYRTTALGSGTTGRIGGVSWRKLSGASFEKTLGFRPILRSVTKLTVAQMAADNPEALKYRTTEDQVSAVVEDGTEDRAFSTLLMVHVTSKNRERFSDFERSAYAHLSETVSDLGFTPIYLVPPRLYLFDRYKPTPTLDFGDPKRHPQYFSIFNRYDKAHLGPAASRLYSADIGKKFVQLVGKN